MPTEDNHFDETRVDYDSISELIPLSREGDVAARDELLLQMQGYIDMMASKHLDKSLQQKVSSADIAQQALTQVIQNFDSFRGQTAAEFRGWLGRIIEREMGKIRRMFYAQKRDVHKEQNIDAASSAAKNYNAPADGNRTPSSEAIAAEQIENFYQTLSKLPDHYSEVIRLKSIENLTYEEIANTMNRTKNSVEKLYFRAVLKFEEELKKSGEFNSEF